MTLDDALALERVITCHRRSARAGIFAVILGEAPPAAWLLDAEQIRISGEDWLDRLPALLAQDATDWSFTTLT